MIKVIFHNAVNCYCGYLYMPMTPSDIICHHLPKKKRVYTPTSCMPRVFCALFRVPRPRSPQIAKTLSFSVTTLKFSNMTLNFSKLIHALKVFFKCPNFWGGTLKLQKKLEFFKFDQEFFIFAHLILSQYHFIDFTTVCGLGSSIIQQNICTFGIKSYDLHVDWG